MARKVYLVLAALMGAIILCAVGFFMAILGAACIGFILFMLLVASIAESFRKRRSSDYRPPC